MNAPTTTTTTGPSATRGAVRPVSQPHDAAEREADAIAHEVASGGHVRDWSVTATPVGGAAGVHRQDAPGPAPSPDPEAKPDKADDNKEYVEAATTTARALAQTDAGKKVQQLLLDLPPVRRVREFADTTAGQVTAAGAGAAYLTGFAVAGRKPPVTLPAFPVPFLGRDTTAQITVERPSDGPQLYFLEIRGRFGHAPTRTREPDPTPAPAQRELTDAEIAEVVDRMMARSPLGFGVLPITPDISFGAAGASGQFQLDEPFSQPRRTGPRLVPDLQLRPPTRDEEPVSRDAEPATTTGPGPRARVDDGFAGPGRALPRDIRTTMEARFGQDFSTVRLHDDGAANAAATRVAARAFTVGEQVVVGPGQDPTSPHLLAHELAHVVQHRARRGQERTIHRLSIGETLARFFGGGTFTDEELTDYLDTIRATEAIVDEYDSDNKARAIVDRFIQGRAGWDVLTVPDRVLLIREMLSGATLGGDERAILVLLREAIPSERVVIVQRVGLALLRDNFSGANLRALNELVETGDEDVAFDSLGVWTVEGVRQRITRHDDATGLARLLADGWTIVRFETAHDTWQLADGTTQERENRNVMGNTSHLEKVIRLRDGMGNETAGMVLFHEVDHALRRRPEDHAEGLEGEVQARVAGEEYLIRRGLPPVDPTYRRADGTVDVDAIRADVTGSGHYNPQDREWVGRRWEGEQPTNGWDVADAQGVQP